MIKYGLISKTDGETIEKTIDLICAAFPNGVIDVTEIGLYSGDTGNGIKEYTIQKNRVVFITGVDNFRDGQPISKNNHYSQMLQGNSNEVYNRLPDESQHLIFIDANHSFPHVISDFYCYAPKVKQGGFLLFHDTGAHIESLHGWQLMGDKNDPDMCIAVRKALKTIGLLDNKVKGWRLVFDEADPNDLAGGICVFQKLSND